MRTTVTIDDEILARAQELTGINEKSHLILEALNALIQRESARRLARLGRCAPQIGPPPPRRR
jgi:Arc/MetJ family transcription regulator